MDSQTTDIIERLTGALIERTSAMGGGCVGDVYKVALSDGETLVAKVGDAGSGLALEGDMLRYLSNHSSLPVPDVLHADDTLLLMTLMPAGGSLNGSAQIHAADLVAALHDVSAGTFGFPFDTVIGGLHQPNPEMTSWLSFFAEHRLMEMGRQGLNAGRLPSGLMKRLENFAGNLTRWLEEPSRPSLIHGDMWGGNVLANEGRISGFIDPAIYFADRKSNSPSRPCFPPLGMSSFRAITSTVRYAPAFSRNGGTSTTSIRCWCMFACSAVLTSVPLTEH